MIDIPRSSDKTTFVIKKCLDQWITNLGLRWWDIKVVYYDDPYEIHLRFEQTSEGQVVARVDADWRYTSAKLQFNLPALRDMEDEEIERAIVHELVHILINEMREGGLKHEERVATTLTKAFLWVEADALRRKDAED